DAGACAFRILALHQGRDADGEFHYLESALDVALGVRDGFAVLAGEAVGNLVVVAVSKLEELHQHAGPPLWVGGGPGRLRDPGILDGGGDLGLGGKRHLGPQLAGHWLEHVARAAARALDRLAADEVAVLEHGVSPYACRRFGLRYHALAGASKPPATVHDAHSR